MKTIEEEVEEVRIEVTGLFQKLAAKVSDRQPLVVIETSLLLMMSGMAAMDKEQATMMIANVNMAMADLLLDICTEDFDSPDKSKMN